VSGSGHTRGENISGPTQAQLPTTISYQYDDSLKALSNSINRKLKDKQIPDEKIKSINTRLQQIVNEVEALLKS
jgi:hypothetical protein